MNLQDIKTLFKSMKIISNKTISTLPAEVCIYGAGALGVMFIEKASANGISTIRIFDDQVSGEINNTGIEKFEGIFSEEVPSIIVTSRYYSDIVVKLKRFISSEKIYIYSDQEIIPSHYYREYTGKYSSINNAFYEVRQQFNDNSLALFDKLFLLRTSADLLDWDEEIKELLYHVEVSKEYIQYIDNENILTLFDCGAYQGNATRKILSVCPNVRNIMLFDLNLDHVIPVTDFNYNSNIDVKFFKCALYDKPGKVSVKSNLKTESHVVNSGLDMIDELDTMVLDKFLINNHEELFIKMDIEGSELAALRGASDLLVSNRPQLAISIYHSNADFVEIPEYLMSLLVNYTWEIGHYSQSLNETLLYGKPNEL